jgi:NADPH-dependent 2,4-dienoyl-CoA reductase/sulfur reductase-like enzyme
MSFQAALSKESLRLRERPQSSAYDVRLVFVVLGWFYRFLYSNVLDGNFHGLPNLCDGNIKHSNTDVLVIGAGGAGLRAAIEASAAGVSVGLIC